MQGPTTIQVSRETMARLKTLYPSLTYEAGVQKLLDASGSGAPPTDVHTYSFTKSIPALKQDEVRRPINFKGAIIAAFMHFPTGPSGLVEVRVMLQTAVTDRPVVPSRDNTFIALDNATFPAEGLWVPVVEEDEIRVEWWNYDSNFAHVVPVEVFVLRNRQA